MCKGDVTFDSSLDEHIYLVLLKFKIQHGVHI